MQGMMVPVALIAILAAVARPAIAQCEEAMLRPGDVAEGDRFGYSVAIDGETIVVGAMLEDDQAEDAGAAYVYRFDGTGWIKAAKLVASDGAESDHFGISVALAGDVVVVGASDDDNENGEEAGSAYVFRFDGSKWVEEAHLLASDGDDFDDFGLAVAVAGEVVVIGARGRADGTGAAYVFRNANGSWHQEQILTAPDGAPAENFGFSVAIDQAVIVVGRPRVNLDVPGSAHVFRHKGLLWVYEAELEASDGADNNGFGKPVEVRGTSILVGAQNQPPDSSGAAYLFAFAGDDWHEEAKLTAPDSAPNDDFGSDVALLDGDTVLVTAQAYGELDSGTAYVFRRINDEWGGAQLELEDGQISGFGSDVAADEQRAVVGAYHFEADSGTAYVFDRFDIPTCECVADVTGNGEVSFADLLDVLAAWGPCPLCREDLDGDGTVGFADLLIVLISWGPCPS